MLAVEREIYADPNTPSNVGQFILMGDTLTKFSDRCPNIVTHTNSISKSDIQVRWQAPPAGSGCVIFRATVIEHRDVWYKVKNWKQCPKTIIILYFILPNLG